MRPTQIKQDSTKKELRIIWDDGHISVLSIKLLRDECPCAGCKGEVLFGKVYKPSTISVYQEGMYKIESLTSVGQYAIQIRWKDGHDTGIYSWDYLQGLEDDVKKDE